MTIDFEKELAPQLKGSVQTDKLTRICYSVDASIFQQEPQAVVSPECVEDVVQTVAFAKEHKIPVTPRGAATGITGGCLGPGVILDFSAKMNRILEVDYDKGYAVVEPGVVQDQLNRHLAESGYRLGPDTSTGNRATVGGMFGNNSSGAHSLRYGRTIDAVLEAQVVLSDGNVMTVGADAAPTDLQREVGAIVDELKPEMEARFPKLQRNVAGYCLNELTDGPANLAKLFCGAEGTLGICTKLKLRIVRSPRHVGLILFHFESMADGLSRVPALLERDPFSLELIDRTIIETGRSNPSYTGKLEWLQGSPEAILAFEVDADSEEDLTQKVQECLGQFSDFGYAQVVAADTAAMAEVWQLRKAGLGLLLSRRSYDKAIAFVEDAAVPPEALAGFIADLQAYLDEVGKDVALYGHAGVGLVHVRPMMDLGQDADVDLMIAIMEKVGELVVKHGGTVSGEHGDGMIRSWQIEERYGSKITEGFKRIKMLFD